MLKEGSVMTEQKTRKTRSEVIANDVYAILKSRVPLVWVKTTEEARVEQYLFESAAAAKMKTYIWDVDLGVTDITEETQKISTDDTNPDLLFNSIREGKERAIWVMRDLAPWLTGPTGSPVTLRRLRNVARKLPKMTMPQTIVVMSPSGDVPAELANHTIVVDWPLPDRFEIGGLLDDAIEGAVEQVEEELVKEKKQQLLPNGTRDAAIDAAVGLSGEEAEACFARSLVQRGKIDPLTIAQEKKRVIARQGILEWIDPLPGGLSAVGGLDALKSWLADMALAYSPEARAYGVPTSKGAMFMGVPGCGKTHTAKAVAAAWGVPLLRMDLNALKSKFVGESETNLRKALATIEAIGRCVVWLDEIEKALEGATSGSADGGVSADALGTILSWMQDRQGEAFVIATANDASKLPPELMRKGRFDEIWWVDFPNDDERVSVAAAALRAYGRENVKIDLDKIAAATDTFTGAEIAAIVPDALRAAFKDHAREITTDDLLAAARDVMPMAKTQGERMSELKAKWAGRVREATSPVAAVAAATKRRRIEIDQ